MVFSLKSTTLIILLISLSTIAHTQSFEGQLQKHVDYYADKRGFSGTVLIARKGEILLESSYGKANIEWGVPNSPDARYRIGSLTKPLLATLVMDLVEDGVLSLDGTLGTYLPDLYANTPAAPITVAQLLSHTSGLKDVPGRFDDPWYQTAARLSYEPEAFAKEWIKPVLVTEPGTKWRYNNAGFILLGLIVEKVTGASYADGLETRVFEPAGMTNSGVFDENAVVPKLASAYAPTPAGSLGQPLRVDASVFSSAAGIYSTAKDLYLFDRALYGSAILNADTRKNMMSKKTDFSYGFGWGVEEWPMPDGSKLPVVHHTGSIPGYQSFYLRSEGSEGCVIILNNTNSGGLVIEMGRDLMEVLNGKPIKRRLDDFLLPIADKDGTTAMVAAYEALGDKRSDYDLSERALNRLGYKLLGLKRVEDAIAVLGWNVEEYPNSANTYDSLGEAYRAAGQIEDAIRSYEQALRLNPKMPSAIKALEELRTN